MSTLIIENSRASKVSTSTGWIISKRQDLIWFLGSALVGYLSIALITGFPSQGVEHVTTFVWGVLIAGPHFFATFTRTYFDCDQRRKLSRALWMIVPLSVLPVVVVALGGKTLLVVFGTGWGTFHIAKQHVGIMMLYKRVTGERSKTDFTWDKRFLLASQILPLALFLLWMLNALPRLVVMLAVVAQIAMMLAYLSRQIIKYRKQEEMNWPKLMLFALVIPLHWLAFIFGSSADSITGLLIFSIAVNIGHSLQYHRLMWLHNKHRYEGKTGLTGFVGRSAICYYAASFGLYLFFLSAGLLLPSGGSELLLMGPIFMHYVLDARIWRMRDDPELARALNLS